MKSPKVYDLFWTIHGPTCRSQEYSLLNKRITKVAAVSLKQAMYLAAHDVWYNGTTGIVADREDEVWRYYDGTTGNTPRFKHGRVVPKK